MDENIITLRDAEKKNFENLIVYYKEELIKIEKGEDASTLISQHPRRGLFKIGILERSTNGKYRRHKLSAKARIILKL